MELFKILGTVAIDNQEAIDGIDDTIDKAEKAHPKLKTAFDKMGSAAVAAGKAIASGLAVGTAAIGALLTKSVEVYAEYEQLVGGVETLFKESADIVLKYAEGAYKTAGLSANKYMETVTSFSASLLQGLNGDVAEAAKVADRAITDMSDNANKMGTSMEMIQNAYQGFAKQNYTMLDNLKLGYGGTQAEMARLINESGVLGDTIKVTAETVNSVSFDKIIEAIGVVQDRMGITGTTAKEAAETISGSVASMKAAWTNLLVGMADDEADFKGLMVRFVDSAAIAADNIMERVGIALQGSVELIEGLLPVIVDRIPPIIDEILPEVLQSAVNIVQTLVDGISSNKEIVMNTIFEVCMTIIQTVTEMLPQILVLGADLLLTFINGIVENLDELAESALDMVLSIAEGIVEYLPRLTEASIELIKKLAELLTEDRTLTLLLDAALAIILAIGSALIGAAPELLTAALKITEKLVEFLLEEDNLEKIVNVATTLINQLASGLINNLDVLAESAGKIVDRIILSIFETDWAEIGTNIINSIGGGLTGGDFWDGFTDALGLGGGGVSTALGAGRGGAPTTTTPTITTTTTTSTSTKTETNEPVRTGGGGSADAGSGAGNSGGGGNTSAGSGAGRGGSESSSTPTTTKPTTTTTKPTTSTTTTTTTTVATTKPKDLTKPSIKMAKGGVLEKGQLGFLEGDGAEAVVPLDQNEKWISAVARDMLSAGVNSNVDSEMLRQIIVLLETLINTLPDTMIDAFATMKFDVNNREFARLVKAVN